MRFCPEPVPSVVIDPELSSTMATSSVFFNCTCEVTLKLSLWFASVADLPTSWAKAG